MKWLASVWSVVLLTVWVTLAAFVGFWVTWSLCPRPPGGRPWQDGARRSPPVRTFASEAKRLIRECGLEEPTAAQPGDALTWVLFSTGHFKKRRHHRHGKPYRPRAFFDGTYEPRTR